MAAAALDLSPVVDALLARPFDRETLDDAYSTVNGNPQAYATALRCAAKRTADLQAAAYWLTEAARVHESVDDLGGCIALLSRAWECEPGSARTRELLATAMARLSMRVGVGLTFTPPGGVAGQPPVPLESGMRPPSPGRHRDTLPDLFGLDAAAGGPGSPSEAPGDDRDAGGAPREPSVRRPMVRVTTESGAPPPTTILPPPSPVPVVVPVKVDAPPSLTPVPVLERRLRTVQSPEPADRPRATLIPPPPPEEDAFLLTVRDLATPTRRSTDLPPPPSRRRGPTTLRSEPPASSPPPPSSRAPATSYPPPSSVSAPATLADLPPPMSARCDDEGDAGDRTSDDGLVGALFEQLHGLHFSEHARDAAAYLRQVLEQHLRPSAILVHLYDINTRHFVVVSAAGTRSGALHDYATPEDDPFVMDVLDEGEAVLVLEPATDPRLSRGRWLLVEPRRSVLSAPVLHDGRYLGLVELCDPEGAAEFTEDDRNALTYAAESFGRFLSDRGIVLSDDPTLDRASVELLWP